LEQLHSAHQHEVNHPGNSGGGKSVVIIGSQPLNGDNMEVKCHTSLLVTNGHSLRWHLKLTKEHQQKFNIWHLWLKTWTFI